ncbi:hypothetical protein NEMBOFW57_003695 [Staphylotrichum longicolle]|uniref:Rhodopsin domain-containing protein n=1 Tax=Staphylotrichum longicolle TaxID=669026 RepID=A0AAD4I3J7_9PEZI|nr:hypothetical protein NEMBOFW57_003695 [Staphylotrichum longicolle]
MSDTQPPPAAGPPPLPPDLPHDSLKLNIIISSTICWWIAAFFVGLRFYTRGVIIRVLAWYGILFYLLSLAFSKIAILLLYIHLFTFKWARLAGQILFGVVVVTHLYMALVTFTACIPLQSYWDFTLEKKYCQPQSVWWSNTGLHMVCFISILRLMQLLRSQTDPDFTYAAAPLSYLTAVEINGAIVCACVMTLKPLLSKFWPRFLGLGYYSSRSRSGNNNNSGGYRGRRGSETLVNGDVWIETRGAGGGGSRRVWVDGGYVEIEDGDSAAESWGADVELAENVGREGDGQVMMQPPAPVMVGTGIVRVDTEVRVQVSKAES